MTKVDYSQIDFRLLVIPLELYALEDELQLIETQIERAQKEGSAKIAAYIKENKLHPDDPEWHMAHQAHDDLVSLLLPRFLRGSFLISLYAVYESAVIEIANLIQKKQREKSKIVEFRDFKCRDGFLKKILSNNSSLQSLF
jgi:hypothetical protein